MSSAPNSVRPLFPNLYPDLIFNRLKGFLAFLGTKTILYGRVLFYLYIAWVLQGSTVDSSYCLSIY